jgi:hypothetical protein
MQKGFYHCADAGSRALLLDATELRALARFEFLFDHNSTEGLLLAQFAFDLRRLSAGASLRSTCLWRTFAAQYPRFFQTPEVD